MIRLAILGTGGRMGRMLLSQAIETPGVTLAAAGERAQSPLLGQDAGTLIGTTPLDIPLTADPTLLFTPGTVVIDFTTPAASAHHAGLAAAAAAPLVIGTTGFTADQQAAIKTAAHRIPIMQAANMSLGVTLLAALVEQAAAALPEAYDIEIFELHHSHKIDSPSGTALSLGRAAAAGRGITLDEAALYDRHGPRPAGGIGFAAARGGDVVGDHTILFAGPGERLELTHRAGDRRIYAIGAIKAARWLSGQEPGLYGMRAVLGLE